MPHRRRSPCCIDEAERFIRVYYGLTVDAPVTVGKPDCGDHYIEGYKAARRAVDHGWGTRADNAEDPE